MEQVLFDSSTDMAGATMWHSQPIAIASGKAIRVTAFNLGDGSQLEAKIAYVKDGAVVHTARYSGYEPSYTMTKDNPSIRITEPGNYVLVGTGLSFQNREAVVTQLAL